MNFLISNAVVANVGVLTEMDDTVVNRKHCVANEPEGDNVVQAMRLNLALDLWQLNSLGVQPSVQSSAASLRRSEQKAKN